MFSRSCRWANEYNVLFKIIGNNRYMIIFKETDVDKLVEQKFPNITGNSRHKSGSAYRYGIYRFVQRHKLSKTAKPMRERRLIWRLAEAEIRLLL